PPAGPQQPMVSPNKIVNAATFCRFGQEYIHEIITKATEIFGSRGSFWKCSKFLFQLTNYQDRKTKLEEELKTLCVTFKKLRAIYDKVRETFGGEVETLPVSEVYPYVLEEHRELVETFAHRPRLEPTTTVNMVFFFIFQQVRVKNQQLKEIIDQIRSINWEINTMITMR
ncbi:hypothetical protein LOTGIDRAFT_86853, partial [Lottia gigantea]